MQYPLYHLATLRVGLATEAAGFGPAAGNPCYETLQAMGYSGSQQQVLEQVTADLKAALLPIVRENT